MYCTVCNTCSVNCLKSIRIHDTMLVTHSFSALIFILKFSVFVFFRVERGGPWTDSEPFDVFSRFFGVNFRNNFHLLCRQILLYRNSQIKIKESQLFFLLMEMLKLILFWRTFWHLIQQKVKQILQKYLLYPNYFRKLKLF
jgi:heterodisulfide reductase subunit C